MGGFSSFQKRYGDKTIGNLTLEAIKDSTKPEIYKLAKMFAPDMVLVPLIRTWVINNGRENGYIALDGRYFGMFHITHNITRAPKDSNYEVSRTYIWDGAEQKISLLNGFHGQANVPMHTNSFEYIGPATGVQLANNFTQPEHALNVSFIGFRLEDAPEVMVDFFVDNNTREIFNFEDTLTNEELGVILPTQRTELSVLSARPTYMRSFDSGLHYMINGEEVFDEYSINTMMVGRRDYTIDYVYQPVFTSRLNLLGVPAGSIIIWGSFGLIGSISVDTAQYSFPRIKGDNVYFQASNDLDGNFEVFIDDVSVGELAQGLDFQYPTPLNTENTFIEFKRIEP